MEKEPDYDLVIVGAGFSGLNALAAAVEFHPHLKIAVIEATDHIGGHWNTTYSFVRLHHAGYGIGSHGLVGKNNTRSDILSYAGRVVDDIMTRADLDVTFLWNTRYNGTSAGTVRTSNGTLTAGRVIDTVRYGLPAGVSANNKPLGILPRELSELPPASSYVIIGSGKTAMETLRYLGRPATVIGGTPVCFVTRHVPLLVVFGRALACVDAASVEGQPDQVLERMHENGDVFFFMGQRGGWRYGFTDAHELAESEAWVKEYLPNTHVEGYERGDTLRVFLRGGGERVFDKNTVLVDCRGLPSYRGDPDLNIRALDDGDRVLYTFITDQTDTQSAYTMTAMFLRCDLENLRRIKPPPAAMRYSATMIDALRYMLEMTRVRRGAPVSDASRVMISDVGWIDWIRLWRIKNKIMVGKSLLR